MAFLELLPAPAPARIVAADLLVPRTGRRDLRPGRIAVRAHVRPSLGGLPVAASSLRRVRWRLLGLLSLLRRLHRDAHDRLRHAGRDPRSHLLEELVGLALVGDEGVLLAVAAQVDAFAELLHRREVLDPV